MWRRQSYKYIICPKKDNIIIKFVDGWLIKSFEDKLSLLETK